WPVSRRFPAWRRETDFFSYATGAAAHMPWGDCCRVVVAGHAHHARARTDRSQRKTAMRLLRAIPRRADTAVADHPYRARADRRGSRAARQNIRLRAHLLDRERPRSGPGAGRKSRPESDPGHLARQRPAEESRADFDRG